jgi:ribosomal protein S18 acetylase RimI-like enzyme
MVVDRHQGRGIAGMLMRHLVAIARSGGLRELVAEVLVGNAAMLKLLRKSGLRMDVESELGVTQVTLRL